MVLIFFRFRLSPTLRDTPGYQSAGRESGYTGIHRESYTFATTAGLYGIKRSSSLPDKVNLFPFAVDLLESKEEDEEEVKGGEKRPPQSRFKQGGLEKESIN